MTFEYDINKSQSNIIKHLISFEEAKELWNDPYSFEIPSLDNDNEDRFLVFGKINNKNWTAIITYRDTVIRIISVRKSREKEISFYESIRAR